MSKKNGSPADPEDDQQGTDDEEPEDESQDSDGSSDSGESTSDQEGDSGPDDDELLKLSPEQLAAEVRKQRRENARKRQANKKLREQLTTEQQKAKDEMSAAERADAAERRAAVLESRSRARAVDVAMRDYLSESHPEYLKLARRMVAFVDLKPEDADDEDAIEEAVKKAADAFVKDIPLKAENGQAVGGLGSSPSRGGVPDTSQAKRLRDMFPGMYRNR